MQDERVLVGFEAADEWIDRTVVGAEDVLHLGPNLARVRVGSRRIVLNPAQPRRGSPFEK